MKKPLLILAAASVVGVILFITLRSGEPEYDGRTAREWAREMKPTSLGETNAQLNALLKLGTNAVSAQLELLNTTNSRADKAIASLRNKLPDGLKDRLPVGPSSEEQRAAGAWALGEMGVMAASTVPELRKALKDPSSEVRLNAARALGNMGPEAAGAVEDLMTATKDPVPIVRQTAMDSILKTGPEGKPSIPQLVERLDDPQIAGLAASVIGEQGGAAKAALQDLLKLLRRGMDSAKPNPSAARTWQAGRSGAARALGKLHMDPEQVVPGLIKTLDDPWWQAQSAAVGSLGAFGPAASNAVPSLISLMNKQDGSTDEGRSIQRKGAVTLGQIGPAAADAVPTLEAHLRARKGSAVEIVEAIWRIAPEKGPSLLPALLEALGHYKTIAVLSEMGDAARPVLPELHQILAREWGESHDIKSRLEWEGNRFGAAEAIHGITGDTNNVVPALVKMYQDKSNPLRNVVPDRLWTMTRNPDLVIPMLTELLKDPQSHVRQVACLTLGKMGAVAKPAVPALEEALAHEEDITRRYAAEALRQVSPEAIAKYARSAGTQ